MTTPSGILSLPMKYLRDSLADCAAFRTFAGAADQAAALARIHYFELTPPADVEAYTKAEITALRPYAIVATQDRNGFSAELDGASDHFEFADSGRLWLYVARTVAGDQPELEFCNHLGAIVAGLCKLAGQAGYLALTEISLEAGPFRGHHDLDPTEGIEQIAVFSIDYGTESG